MPKRQTWCPLPGCISPKPEHWTVCHQHSLQIWQQVQLSLQPTETADQRAERLALTEAHRAKTRTQPGWIYFLTLDDKIKIGWTANLEQRLRSYPPHAQVVVSYPGTRADERDLHRSLKPSLVAGREWYEPTPEVVAAMRQAQLDESLRAAAEWAARPKPKPLPAGKPSTKPRQLRGGALVRAITAGEVE